MPLQQHQHFRLDAAALLPPLELFNLQNPIDVRAGSLAIFMACFNGKTMKNMESQPFLGGANFRQPPFLHLKKHRTMLATGASRARCRGAERSGPIAPT